MQVFRKFNWFTSIALTVALLSSVIGSSATISRAQGNTPLTKVTLFLGYIKNIQFAPLYVAMENGYFSDAGIDLSIEYSFDETDGLTRIATGKLQFGLISGEQVLLARSEGAPVIYVFRWYQKFPVGIVVPADSAIKTPADLAGKVVGVPGKFGASYTGLQALLASVGLKESDLKEVKAIGFDTAPVMCANQVEASVVYIANEPEQIKKACFDVRVIKISDYANLVSNGLVTNEDTIANQPDLVRGMTLALDRGLAATISDPQAAMTISTKYVDNLKSDDAVQKQVLLNSIELWNADRLGANDPDAWAVMEKTLRAMGTLKKPLDIASAYTDSFLPPVVEATPVQ